MIRSVWKNLTGKRRVQIHSRVIKPLNHRGIYEYREYLMHHVKEGQRSLPPVVWTEKERGA
ncbi:hypothetical protein C8P63_10120 [Melghirimyces profundicolus]|uniref:Transposase n=1 Tax=Melghirimyces profundicolus TaxID=1242148 RepID=A0A2T6C924_9BACL|nr:hypothetical protein [Melghirimyces profundicolus]PTX64804.1 hypothetical protein C8P63_10120 [Melghirimyces profundicolus]